ncbi:MAG TPA: MBL fold metallo-hydrolase [Myxococcales bacterium]|jgi:putative mRNA 3-end processing factor
MKPALPPEVERAANGLRVRGHPLVLDPRGRPALGFVAHARGAPRILPERSIATAATVALLEAAQPRALRKSAALPAAYGKPFALGSLRLTVHPAGHVLGSAQLRVEGPGLDLVWAADLGGSGRRASATAEPLEQLECETLALNALYGHPRYQFPPRDEALERALEFVQKTRRSGQTPVLIASPFGATQDVLRHFDGRALLRLHPAAHRACEVYAALGVKLSGYVKLDEAGDTVVVPPSFKLSRLPAGSYRTCILSGRAMLGHADADEAIALSDHAGFDELVDYAQKSQAQRVIAVHGHADELARALREKGMDAVALRDQHQLRLPGF